MKVITLGGGPGGLYASILLKKANPSWDIRVLERNPRGATYGFGVVLSDRTLTSFREADHKTYADLLRHQVTWNSVDVLYRGETVRSGGHTFAGISRKTLLDILQRRCEQLGVRVSFETDTTSLPEAGKPDLLIGADGVHSLVKKTFQAQLEPSSREGNLKFIWLGTHRLFDAFTFIFRENEHGVFQVHAYPYDGTTSTAVIMCHRDTWLRAGLDQATEAETLAYLERLFRDDLQSNHLISNNSKWVSFATFKLGHWHHRNIVVLGDAAHTVHFTIGSGTKLAMEDAIALASAFERKGTVEEALPDYEMDRRGVLDRFQAVAGESETYFENIERYMALEPLQFAFQLLTRSRTIDYENLRMRDAAFSDTVDRWFVSRELKAEPVVAPSPLLTPLRISGRRFSNRVALSVPALNEAVEGVPPGQYEELYRRLAERQAGLLLTEPVAVEAEGRVTPESCGLYSDDQANTWERVVDAVHGAGDTQIVLQLGHAGRRGATRSRRFGLDVPLPEREAWPLVAPSPISYTPHSAIPAEAAEVDLERICHAFRRATERAVEIGVDALQIHMGQGYLLASFLSPLTNQRTDCHGGSIENRARFPIKVFEAVRQVWPADRPLFTGLSTTDCASDGITLDDVLTVAERLKEVGCDLIHVLAGQTVRDEKPSYGRSALAAYSERIRIGTGLLAMVGGNITTTSQMNTILAAGRADLCLLRPRHLQTSEALPKDAAGSLDV